jgi:hypothetical protein
MTQVFLLGAGFTRAVVGEKAPLTHELMPKLDISKFPEIREDYEKAFPDIEQFLSVLDLNALHFCQINKSYSDRLDIIRENIAQQIVKQVDIDSLYVDNLDNYLLLKEFTLTIPKDSYILSLNYDCVLVQGLYLSDRWSPFGGYYFSPFHHPINENDLKDKILLLKLHGSCNFRNVVENQEYPHIEINNSIFPNIKAGIDTIDNSSDKGPHVIVMSYIKQFHNGIMSLWGEAISCLRNTEKLVIVGCSLREEDTFLRFALYHFGMKKNTKKFFINIIDKGEVNCKKIKEKIIGLVAHPDRQEISLFHDGLEGYLKMT